LAQGLGKVTDINRGFDAFVTPRRTSSHHRDQHTYKINPTLKSPCALDTHHTRETFLNARHIP
jgi:hypothetical protein